MLLPGTGAGTHLGDTEKTLRPTPGGLFEEGAWAQVLSPSAEQTNPEPLLPGRPDDGPFPLGAVCGAPPQIPHVGPALCPHLMKESCSSGPTSLNTHLPPSQRALPQLPAVSWWLVPRAALLPRPSPGREQWVPASCPLLLWGQPHLPGAGPLGPSRSSPCVGREPREAVSLGS